MANRILITWASRWNFCHNFFINSKSTLSHGARIFYFNLSLFFPPVLNAEMSCRAHATKSILQIWLASHARGFGGETFRYRTRFICVSSYAAFYRSCQSSEAIMGNFASFFELAVGGKFSVPLKRFCARLNSLILITKRHSSLPFPLKHYCLSKPNWRATKKGQEKLINYLKYTKKMKNEISLRFPLFCLRFFHIICNLLAWHC